MSFQAGICYFDGRLNPSSAETAAIRRFVETRIVPSLPPLNMVGRTPGPCRLRARAANASAGTAAPRLVAGHL